MPDGIEVYGERRSTRSASRLTMIVRGVSRDAEPLAGAIHFLHVPTNESAV